jgi:hypothetical protein
MERPELLSLSDVEPVMSEALTLANRRQRDLDDATMASDWQWILAVLRMTQDRALTGTPLHLRRPEGWPASADIKYTMRRSIVALIDDILRTAIVDELDEKSNV